MIMWRVSKKNKLPNEYNVELENNLDILKEFQFLQKHYMSFLELKQIILEGLESEHYDKMVI